MLELSNKSSSSVFIPPEHASEHEPPRHKRREVCPLCLALRGPGAAAIHATAAAAAAAAAAAGGGSANAVLLQQRLRSAHDHQQHTIDDELPALCNPTATASLVQ